MRDFEPYYAVIFTSRQSSKTEGYAEMSEKLDQMLQGYPGFRGMDHARSAMGITICYWDDLASIENWKNEALHQEAQQKGKGTWYSSYTIRVCKVEKEYGMKPQA